MKDDGHDEHSKRRSKVIGMKVFFCDAAIYTFGTH